MKFLQELVSFYRINNDLSEVGTPHNTEIHDRGTQPDSIGMVGDKMGDDYGRTELDQEDAQELTSLLGKVTEDPDRQGLIRKVKGAHLVYKRQTEDGTFEELWIYKINNVRDEIEIRKAILAGTDIPVNKLQSPDNAQSYEVWTIGDIEMLHIKGLQQ